MAVTTVLQVWGVIAAVLFVSWNVYRNVSLGKLMYYLYAHTPVGTFVHSKQLAASRGKPAHSKCSTVNCGSYTVHSIAYLDSNYAYIIHDHATNECAVVDPADDQRVLKEFDAYKTGAPAATLTAVLTTHHHMDHAGGNKAMRKAIPSMKVYGGFAESVPGVTVTCADNDTIQVGETTVDVLYTPCHTFGHLMYYIAGKAGSTPSLFTGDMVFVAGCGKFFEGNGTQFAAAVQRVSKLPAATNIFSGHEYALPNLEFANFVLAENAAVAALVRKAQAARTDNMPVLTTLGEELAHNPFLRLNDPAIRRICGIHPSEPAHLVATILRGMKDRGVHKRSHDVTERPLL